MLEVAFEYDALCRKRPTSQVEDEPFVTVYSQYTDGDTTGLRSSVHYIIQKPNYIEIVCVVFDSRILSDCVEACCEVLRVNACRGMCSKF
jgi:hypothetical protein